MKAKYNNATFLDNLVGDKGFKADVAVEIKPATIPIVIGSVMVAVVAGILIAGLIQRAIAKK